MIPKLAPNAAAECTNTGKSRKWRILDQKMKLPQIDRKANSVQTTVCDDCARHGISNIRRGPRNNDLLAIPIV
jgi:hypothetical protein